MPLANGKHRGMTIPGTMLNKGCGACQHVGVRPATPAQKRPCFYVSGLKYAMDCRQASQIKQPRQARNKTQKVPCSTTLLQRYTGKFEPYRHCMPMNLHAGWHNIVNKATSCDSKPQASLHHLNVTVVTARSRVEPSMVGEVYPELENT